MKITTFGRQVTVTEDLKILFDKKLGKLDKFFRDDADCNVTLRERKNGRKVLEVTITAGSTLFRAETEEETFQNALDKAVSTIERQIRKNKTRLEKRLRETAFDYDAQAFEEPIEEEGDFDIRVKSFSFKPMSPEEAILQMNLLGHEFFVFENDETGEVNVVYKRHAKKYGLIVPD
ncbi:MAG: ribosome-associated translation inhibitor RaiA [Ruminococcaceae bacterium]|nr:ribosome-associated translation inhibitor RaiA [Oscillospiraceae bacterium]